jgi:choline dehydrogenase
MSPFEVNQKRGVRWNASKAFLREAQQRSNLTVVTGALIDKLCFAADDPTRVNGIDFIVGGTRQRATARREVVLAAGSLGSPAILQRSGIGHPDDLARAGVELRLALPGVGHNLQDHLQLRTIYKVSNIVTLNQRANSLWGKALMGLEYALFRSGPLSMAPSQLGGFARSAPEVATPDLEFHVQPLSLDKFGDPLHRFPAFTASICQLRPSSRGSSLIRDSDPASSPRIAPNYLSTDHDRATAVAALKLTRRVVAQPALAPFAPLEHLPGVAAQSDAELARAAGDIGTTIFHPVGTCKMGRANEDDAVVDSHLRVRGLRCLRVVDASIMPTITSGNTNSPTLMIAERGAALIRAAAKES